MLLKVLSQWLQQYVGREHHLFIPQIPFFKNLTLLDYFKLTLDVVFF